MGILSDFVKDKMQREHDQRVMQLDAFTKLASDPNADEQTRQWAYESMTGFHPDAKKAAKDPGAVQSVLSHLKGLIGLNHGSGGGDAGGGGSASPQPQLGPNDTAAPSMTLPDIQGPSPEGQPSGPDQVAAMLGQTPPPRSPIHIYTSDERAKQEASASHIKSQAAIPDEVAKQTALRAALDPLDVKKAVDIKRANGELDTAQSWDKFNMELNQIKMLIEQGLAPQDAYEAVIPGYTRAPSTSSLPVEQQEMAAWLAQPDNKGKTAADWYDYKQKQGGEPLYPVMENGKPVLRPRSAAAGMPTPTTIYQASGVPSVGGVSGLSTQPPPPVPDITQTALAGWQQSIHQIDQIMPLLQQAEQSLGPLSGRIKLAEVEKLGGMGATPAQIELATRLRRLLMSQAFAEGGKQLTPTEKEEFVAINPHMTDTLQQAMINARLSKEYLQDRYNARLANMPYRERAQMEVDNTRLNDPGNKGGNVIMVGPDGKQWNVPAANVSVFESNGYKRK